MADSVGLGDAAAVELTGVGVGEEDETGGEIAGWSEMGDSVIPTEIITKLSFFVADINPRRCMVWPCGFKLPK